FGVRSGRWPCISYLTSAAALLLILGPAGLYAQSPAPTGDTSKSASVPPDEPVKIESRKPTNATGVVTTRRPVDIRVNKTLVLINVTVTDPLNRFVTGLEKQHFRLYEDKV